MLQLNIFSSGVLILSEPSAFPIYTINEDELKFGLDKIIQEKIKNAKRSPKPVVIHMVGVPGSGKSTLANLINLRLQDMSDEVFCFIAFDQIMSEISNYKNIKSITEAFETFELPAREAGYLLLKKLLEKNASIIFDHSGADPKHVDLLTYCKEKLGYQTIMIGIGCNINQAKKRVQMRCDREGRYTPLQYVEERNAWIEKLIPKYRELVSLFLMFDNTDENMENVEKISDSYCKQIMKITAGK